MIGKQATIYTDGSCIGNPGPGGWAAVILCNGKQIELSGGASDTTNNRMELMGLIQGLKALDKDTTGVKIYSDSQYVVRAFNNGWLKSWKKNGWKRKGTTAISITSCATKWPVRRVQNMRTAAARKRKNLMTSSSMRMTSS